MNNQFNLKQFVHRIISQFPNPEIFFYNIAQQNPQFRAILNQKNQSGMSWEQTFKQLARQNNVDLTGQLNQLSEFGIKL